MNNTDTLEMLVEVVREVLPELEDQPIGPADTLPALGANSLDRADIVMIALERLDLDLPLVDTVGPVNLGELADLLTEKSRAASGA